METRSALPGFLDRLPGPTPSTACTRAVECGISGARGRDHCTTQIAPAGLTLLPTLLSFSGGSVGVGVGQTFLCSQELGTLDATVQLYLQEGHAHGHCIASLQYTGEYIVHIF